MSDRGSQCDLAELHGAFPNLSARIGQLNDLIARYHVLKGMQGPIVGTWDPDAPHIRSARFERDKAERYERLAERYFSSRLSGKSLVVPKPDFPVVLTVGFRGGTFEEFEYDFSTFDDSDMLEAFCRAVCFRDLCLQNQTRS